MSQEDKINQLNNIIESKDVIIDFLQTNCLNEEHLSDDLLKHYRELLSAETTLTSKTK